MSMHLDVIWKGGGSYTSADWGGVIGRCVTAEMRIKSLFSAAHPDQEKVEYSDCKTRKYIDLQRKMPLTRAAIKHYRLSGDVELTLRLSITDDFLELKGCTFRKFINYQVRGNETPLMCAVASPLLESVYAVETLLALKADVNISDNRGETALMRAAWHGYTDIARALVLAKADVEARDNEGTTPLMHATSGGWDRHSRVVEYLVLEAGAKLDSRDYLGRTAVERAIDCMKEPYWPNCSQTKDFKKSRNKIIKANIRILLQEGAKPYDINGTNVIKQLGISYTFFKLGLRMKGFKGEGLQTRRKRQQAMDEYFGNQHKFPKDITNIIATYLPEPK